MRVFVWWGCLAAGLLMLSAPALAGTLPTLRLDIDANQLRIAPEGYLETQHGLWRAQLSPSRGVEDPAVVFQPGTVHVNQYWRNSTVLLYPTTDRVLHRNTDQLEARTVNVDSERLYLTWPKDGADVRVLADAPGNIRIATGPDTTLTTKGQVADLLQPRALAYAAPLLSSFSERPENSGWAQFQLRSLEGPGDLTILIDGWDLRLSGPQGDVDVHTGITVDTQTPTSYREHYSFVVLTVNSAPVAFPQADTVWDGYLSNPVTGWNGEARIHRATGILTLEGVTGSIQENDLRITGDFQAWITFPADPAVTSAHALVAGLGTSSVLPPGMGEGRIFSVSPQIGLGAPLVLGLLMLGMLGVRATRDGRLSMPAWRAAPKAGPPSPTPKPSTRSAAQSASTDAAPTPPMGLSEAQERVRAEPLNSEARLELGVALFKAQRPREAVGHLDRCFRLNPEALLKFLESPSYAEVRQTREVRQLLGRIQREQHWKVWTGYA